MRFKIIIVIMGRYYHVWSGEHAENYMIYSALEFSIKPEYMQNELRGLVNNFRKAITEGEVDYEGYHDF